MPTFEPHDLSDDLEAVRAAYAPDCTVVTAGRDFETLPPAAAEDLGLLAESLDPTSYPAEWLPDDAPDPLRRFAGGDFTVGMPGDGTVVWTRQTVPPTVIAKKRAEGTPEPFRSFLFAEAFVELSLDVPEQFLPFFGERYRELDAAVPRGPGEVYQVAAALYDAWVGLHSREAFRGWESDHPTLFEAWREAGDTVAGRLDDLSGEVARGETSFAAATEYACSAVKHDLDLPAPFAALDTEAYRDHGAEYAVRWAETTFEKITE
ncbi:DUF7089 family protein [Candidatus Halobonum tyrrellensis]|uniref:Uncharacterized protein n=1 Tax=Candidatus Halobonum tyrrellensis G22 TaxID=1324957 RepID=V4GS66_9EURY|nr:hypothetical protein [Candidatus Halobonum tyrrellensis]ESP87921.1 hypothetical protein K933_11411 [Candidatus Halobonum tyrrellensis G22]